MLELSFPRKLGLPESFALVACPNCDFAYISPANQEKYDKYYQSVQSDLLHQEASSSDHREKVRAIYNAQAKRFKTILEQSSALNILDYGCGSGGLLHTLINTHPQHVYYGFDLNSTGRTSTRSISGKPLGPKIKFLDTNTRAVEFDFVILSHVLEHLVDLKVFREVLNLLKPGGTIYIEVPNAIEYKNYPRREYLFYIDRLHVNHFSNQSLRKLTEYSGLVHLRTGRCTFPFKDGGRYPAIYILAKKPLAVRSSLKRSLKDYITNENLRNAASLLPNNIKGVLVYGFGDNFFRARSCGGPLSNVTVLAIIDRRVKELKRSKYSSQFDFMSLKDAIDRYPNAPVVITVSWDASSIIDIVRTLTRAPIFVV